MSYDNKKIELTTVLNYTIPSEDSFKSIIIPIMVQRVKETIMNEINNCQSI